MPKTHTDEFLISELHRFVNEFGFVPTAISIGVMKDYPSAQAYKSHFGTWNNGLKFAKLELNCSVLDGTEVCSYCGKRADEIPNFKHWLYRDGIRYCMRHGNSGKGGKPDYVTKNLDSKSNVGKGFVSQRVVAKTLDLELKNDCNCSIGFNAPYDLYNEDGYNYINVKDSHLQKDNAWHFHLKHKKIPDTYIMIGFDEERKNILHVWITDAVDDLTYDEKNERLKRSISITNNIDSGLKRAKPWEVDAKPYDDMLHKMSEKRKETNGEECFLSNDNLCR